MRRVSEEWEARTWKGQVEADSSFAFVQRPKKGERGRCRNGNEWEENERTEKDDDDGGDEQNMDKDEDEESKENNEEKRYQSNIPLWVGRSVGDVCDECSLPRKRKRAKRREGGRAKLWIWDGDVVHCDARMFLCTMVGGPMVIVGRDKEGSQSLDVLCCTRASEHTRMKLCVCCVVAIGVCRQKLVMIAS